MYVLLTLDENAAALAYLCIARLLLLCLYLLMMSRSCSDV